VMSTRQWSITTEINTNSAHLQRYLPVRKLIITSYAYLHCFRLESKVVETNTRITNLEKELQQAVTSEDFDTADNLNRTIDESKSSLLVYQSDISTIRSSILNLRSQRNSNQQDLVIYFIAVLFIR
jgi:hypothetical protein